MRIFAGNLNEVGLPVQRKKREQLDLGLKGRSVIVAASSEGIARAAAAKFAQEGARVAMCSRDAGKLNDAADEIRSRYSAVVIAEPLDVTDESAVREFVEHVAHEFDGVDVCVTNAGGPPPRMFLETTSQEWRRAVELNFMSAVSFARAVVPHMQRKRWGRLVTITSITVRQPVSDLIYSNAVRAGVVGLVKSLSNEFGKDGITVNNVAPGFTATERLKQLARARGAEAGRTEAESLAALGAQTALGRVGAADEVADAIVWLASERASYITGQTLLVDGGLFKGI
jgi:3-oxoacyl-[acyl-carrier protein] reductase